MAQNCRPRQCPTSLQARMPPEEPSESRTPNTGQVGEYRQSTLSPERKSPENARQGAGSTQRKGNREGYGEEDVLVRDVRVDAAVVDHQRHRGYRYAPHQGAGDAEGVKDAHLQ